MSKNQTAPCQDCGEPSTRTTVDGVPLCEGDYQHLREHGELDAAVQRWLDDPEFKASVHRYDRKKEIDNGV